MAGVLAKAHAKLNDGAAAFSSTLNMRMFETTEGNKTSFVWVVGKFRDMRVGTAMVSQPFIAGDQKWHCLFYPKGFTRQDCASLYLVSRDAKDDACAEDWQCFVQFNVLWAKKEVIQHGQRKKKAPLPEGVPGGSKAGGSKAGGSKAGGSKAGGSKAGGSKASGSKAGGSVKDGASASGKGASETGSKKGSKSGGGSQTGSVRSGGSKAGSRSGSQEGGSAAGSVAEGEEEEEEEEEEEGEEEEGGDKKDQWKLWRSFSMMFTKKDPSWGFADMINLQDLYNPRSGWMTQATGEPFTEGETTKDGERKQYNPQDGRLELKIEVTAVAGLATEIEKEPERTPEGRERVTWIIHNFHEIVKKMEINQKISSKEFESDGTWYFDFYPKGYWGGMEHGKPDLEEGKWVSLFLHSGREQSEKGQVLKQIFSLGIKIQSKDKSMVQDPTKQQAEDHLQPGDVEKVCDITTIFRGMAASKGEHSPRVFGKRKFKRLEDFRNNRYLSGDCQNGGDVYFVLEMLTTCEHMIGVTQQLLLPLNSVSRCSECQSFFYPWTTRVNCFQCGDVFCESCTLHQARLPEYGYERGKKRIIDALFKETGIRAWLKPQKEGKVEAITNGEEAPGGEPVLVENAAAVNSAVVSTDEKWWPVVKVVDTLFPKIEISPDELDDEERQRLETAYFEKPVCTKCAESLRSKSAMKVVYPSEANEHADERHPSVNYREKVWLPKHYDPANNNYGWKRRGWFDLELRQGAGGKGGQPDFQKHARCLARGGPYIESLATYKFCPGKVLNQKTTLMEQCKKDLNVVKMGWCQSCARPFCSTCLKQKPSMKELDVDKAQSGFSSGYMLCNECIQERASGIAQGEQPENAWAIRTKSKEPEKPKVEEIKAKKEAPPPEKKEKPFHKRYCGFIFKDKEGEEEDDAAEGEGEAKK